MIRSEILFKQQIKSLDLRQINPASLHWVLKTLNLPPVPIQYIAQHIYPLEWMSTNQNTRDRNCPYDGVHEPSHFYRVLIMTYPYAMNHLKWNNSLNMETLGVSAGVHDMKRCSNLRDDEHGLRAWEFIASQSEFDHLCEETMQQIRQALIYHAFPDQISPETTYTGVYFNESDMSDRHRGPNGGDLDPRFSRCGVSELLFQMSYDLVHSTQHHPQIEAQPLKTVIQQANRLGIVTI